MNMGKKTQMQHHTSVPNLERKSKILGMFHSDSRTSAQYSWQFKMK